MSASFDHYEKDSHSRPPPPGVPFGYVLEVTTCSCHNCGRQQVTSRLFQLVRAGLGSARLGVGASTPVFDRPIKRYNKFEATPVCLECVEDLVPTPVNYPVPGAVLNNYKPPATPAPKSTAPSKTNPTAAAKVVTDFI